MPRSLREGERLRARVTRAPRRRTRSAARPTAPRRLHSQRRPVLRRPPVFHPGSERKRWSRPPSPPQQRRCRPLAAATVLHG